MCVLYEQCTNSLHNYTCLLVHPVPTLLLFTIIGLVTQAVMGCVILLEVYSVMAIYKPPSLYQNRKQM